MILKLFDNMSQCTETEVQRLLLMVSAQRREQALRFRFLLGRFSCLKSYEMLKQCVEEVISDVSEESEFKQRLLQWNGSFVYNEHGKPMMQDAKTGEAISGVDFSISHCKQGIAVVLDSQPIGVDIESFRTPSDSLLRKTMNEQEIIRIKDAANPSVEFIRFWTQKEALVKMSGTGLVDELPELLAASEVFASASVKTLVNEERQYVCTLICSKTI